MFFQSKLNRAMEWLKNKSSDSDEINNENKEDLEFEKTDILALIISALLVFAPIIIIILIIFYLVLQIG